MKTKLIIIAALATVCFVPKTHAQWTSAAPNAYFNLSGNVEIGNPTTPTFPNKLYVETGTTGDGIKINQTGGTATDDATLFLQLNGADYWSLNHNANTDFHLFESASGGNIRMIVKNTTGNVGIGTNAPTAKLDVFDNSAVTSVFAIHGLADLGGTNNYGVYGETGGTAGTGINAGVYGKIGDNSAGTINAAIYGDANGFSTSTDWACYFVGRTYSSGGGWTSSDLRYKKDITEIKNASAKLMNLKPYSYQFRRDEFPDRSFDKGTHFGFIAQELKEIFPELVTEDGKGYYAVNYQEMIPLLLSAFKEQQQEIQDLKNQISSQKQSTTTSLEQLSQNNSLSVEQNIPNPFTHETTIQFSLPQSVINAQLLVYDLAGKQIAALPVNDRGSTSLNFSANDLAAGIYLYAIVADGKMSDTKRMVVANK